MSQLTIQLTNFITINRIYRATHSSVAVSMLWVVYFLPPLLLAPIAGAVVDAFSRRKMMIITNLLQAGSVVLLLFIGRQAFLIYAVVFLYSLFDQLYLPSQQASVPGLVSKSMLPAANGLFVLTQQLSLLVGFGMGGIFLTGLGYRPTVVLATLFLVIAAVAVYLLPKDVNKKRVTEKDFGKFWNDFLVGYRFIKKNHGVLMPLLILIFTQVFITIIAVILPDFSQNILNTDLAHASIYFIVPGGIGAVLSTYYLPNLMRKFRKKQIIETGILTGGIALLLMSSLHLWGDLGKLIAVFLSLGMGYCVAAIMVPCQTMLQEETPAWFRGRVYSSLTFLVILATSVPMVLSALVADAFGVGKLIAFTGLGLIAGFIYMKKKGDHVLANGFGF